MRIVDSSINKDYQSNYLTKLYRKQALFPENIDDESMMISLGDEIDSSLKIYGPR